MQTMSSLGGGDEANDQQAVPAKTDDAAALTLAVKSTPSLNNAFNKRKNSHSRATSKYFTTQQHEVPTCASEIGGGFEKPANLNILSHEDLTSANL